MRDLVRLLSSLYVIKADPERRKNKLLDEAVLAGASLALLALIQAHSSQIEEYIRKLYAGELSPGLFRSQFERLLSENAQSAYAAGTGRALTDADRKFVSRWVNQQSGHIRSFLDDHLTDAELATPLQRAAMWGASLGALGTIAFMKTNPAVMGTWNYGDTLRHCETCSSLHGKSMPLSDYLARHLIPQEPGSKTLSCGGWKCKCTVTDTVTGKLLLPLQLRE